MVLAEKIQEQTPLSEVCISQVTRERVKEYHGFDVDTNKKVVAGLGYYLLQGNEGLKRRM